MVDTEINKINKELLEALDIYMDYIHETEEKFGSANALTDIVMMMNYLLEIHTNASQGDYPQSCIASYRRKLIEEIKWNESEQSYDKTIVTKLLGNYGEIYKTSVCVYRCKKDPNFKIGLKHIPEECPWTLWDLVSAPLYELLSMIPAVDEYDEE